MGLLAKKKHLFYHLFPNNGDKVGMFTITKRQYYTKFKFCSIGTYITTNHNNNGRLKKRNVRIKPAQPRVQTEPKRKTIMDSPSYRLLV